ncbi:uncharacterized protein B0T15DRAFT_568439 [Chaetomium strumarium]|uniref:Tetraspanin-like protein n=1 Tax=Chaetomium strumarium TaxID=1170767 RepID=A0AAJ0GR92_9PEZI|nr:hypothetical protein B0T15DRAFT_568439 [Chaetomium strumarium]
MAMILIVYSLIILALLRTHNAGHLSLPIPPVLTILTILLPFLSLFTTLFIPHLFFHPRSPYSRNRNCKHTTSTTPSPTILPLSIQPLLPSILHIVQLILTTLLATSFACPLLSRSTTSCLLHNKWLALYSSHNADAVRCIQDALACCGFRTPRDMAWPFPRGSYPAPGACEAQFGRHTPCLPEWDGTLRRVAGGELGVVLAVGVLQVLVVFLVGRYRHGTSTTTSSSTVDGDWGWVRRLFGGSGLLPGYEPSGGEGSRRPMLAAPGEDVETERVDEEEGEGKVRDGEEREDGSEEQRGTGGYGGVAGAGPMVEPAHHDPWAGVQRG